MSLKLDITLCLSYKYAFALKSVRLKEENILEISRICTFCLILGNGSRQELLTTSRLYEYIFTHIFRCVHLHIHIVYFVIGKLLYMRYTTGNSQENLQKVEHVNIYFL